MDDTETIGEDTPFCVIRPVTSTITSDTNLAGWSWTLLTFSEAETDVDTFAEENNIDAIIVTGHSQPTEVFFIGESRNSLTRVPPLWYLMGDSPMADMGTRDTNNPDRTAGFVYTSTGSQLSC